MPVPRALSLTPKRPRVIPPPRPVALLGKDDKTRKAPSGALMARGRGEAEGEGDGGMSRMMRKPFVIKAHLKSFNYLSK